MFRPLKLVGVVVALTALTLTIAGGAASSAGATGANFVATGHDMDFHCSHGTPEECEYLKIVLNKVRAGSTLPILAIDQGGEVATALEDAGYAPGEIKVVDPLHEPEFAATPFVDGEGHPLYSAIITASDSTCGGCDDSPEGEANINARAKDFEAFFNGGGGILALAGADNFPTYYNFVPLEVGAVAVQEPFTVEPPGIALGVTSEMANCCATHNSFHNPPAAPLVVLESDDLGNAETIAAFGAVISGGAFTTPPPPSPPPPPPTTTTSSSTPAPATEVKASKVAKKACKSSRGVTLHWQTSRSVTLDQVTISLNGKRYKHLAGSAREAHVSFAGRGPGAVTVKILGTSSGGNYVSIRTFHPCVTTANNASVRTLVLRHA